MHSFVVQSVFWRLLPLRFFGTISSLFLIHKFSSAPLPFRFIPKFIFSGPPRPQKFFFTNWLLFPPKYYPMPFNLSPCFPPLNASWLEKSVPFSCQCSGMRSERPPSFCFWYFETLLFSVTGFYAFSASFFRTFFWGFWWIAFLRVFWKLTLVHLLFFPPFSPRTASPPKAPSFWSPLELPSLFY